MPQTTPITLKGFRDFLPAEKRQRDYVVSKIKPVFERFGFEPLETPTLEYAELLLGKYGTEADKLVYTFADKGERQVGLRYDQTVPTARVLAQYQNELPRYFRRYQMQNVFRADKPQKGRFREFAQCDIDIFGTNSELADAEILACTYAAYTAIGFPEVVLNINDRQTLMATLQPFATNQVNVFSIIQSIDKLDKETPQEVAAELVSKGLAETAAVQAIAEIEKAEKSSNLSKIVDSAVALGVPVAALRFNPKLARGLDYYTGLIFEVQIPGYTVGSVGGGGRYDNLIADLSDMQMPAVGMAFGFDRTVEAAVELGLVPAASNNTQVLGTIFDDSPAAIAASLAAAQQLRAAGISTELYPSLDRPDKQLKLADQKNIRYVVIIGESELQAGQVTLKDLQTREQKQVSVSELISELRQ